jgi:hypothetical protein
MIDVSFMVHVYKIANEKVANMYYLKKKNHGACILSFSLLVRLVRYLTGTGCHRP